jgi:phage tail protein X
MKRHEKHNKKKMTENYNDKKKIVYQTNIFPKIDRHETDIYIHARDGDRLDNLAYQYYKDVTLWWVLAQANQLGKGSMYIKPPLQIRIPHMDRVFDIVSELYEIQRSRL